MVSSTPVAPTRIGYNAGRRARGREGKMDKEAGGIQVIARAAAILRAVGRQGMSLGALARDTGLPRSTVQRIVDALATEHFV